MTSILNEFFFYYEFRFFKFHFKEVMGNILNKQLNGNCTTTSLSMKDKMAV